MTERQFLVTFSTTKTENLELFLPNKPELLESFEEVLGIPDGFVTVDVQQICTENAQ